MSRAGSDSDGERDLDIGDDGGFGDLLDDDGDDGGFGSLFEDGEGLGEVPAAAGTQAASGLLHVAPPGGYGPSGLAPIVSGSVETLDGVPRSWKEIIK